MNDVGNEVSWSIKQLDLSSISYIYRAWNNGQISDNVRPILKSIRPKTISTRYFIWPIYFVHRSIFISCIGRYLLLFIYFVRRSFSITRVKYIVWLRYFPRRYKSTIQEYLAKKKCKNVSMFYYMKNNRREKGEQ